MQDSQFVYPQSPMQNRSSAMVKVTELDESLLCDDILNCILALDEVIAEFDDPHSISSPVEPPACSAAPLITPLSTLSTFGDSEGRNRSLATTVKQGSSSSSTSPSQFADRQDSFPFSTSGLMKSSHAEVVSTSSQAPRRLHGESVFTNSDTITLRVFNKEEREELAALKDMESVPTDSAKSKKRKGVSSPTDTKIPSLKIPTSAIPILSGNVPNGGGGGSFPKVKLRSTNPLLEYRSVKMQNFVLPDELPPEIQKENWNFPTGKNLPRSLSRTRDTCIGDGDSAALKAANPRFKESSGDVKINSKIPKLKLDICNIYEDTSNLSHNLVAKSPSTSSESCQSPSTPSMITGRKSKSESVSNIPVPKPRKTSSSRQGHHPSSVIKATSSTPKSESTDLSSQRAFASSLPKSGKDAGVGSQRNSGNFNESDIQFFENFSFNNGHLGPEADDGYLSMVNKAEDNPLLWPEEMIENEIFTDDELKRLPYHGEDPYFPVDIYNNEFGAEKTDYFSDDSLESESVSTNGKGTYSKSSNPLVKSKKIPPSISFVCQVDYIRPVIKSPETKYSELQNLFLSSSAEESPLPKKPCSFFVPIESEKAEIKPTSAPPRFRKHKRYPLCCVQADKSNESQEELPVTPFQPCTHDQSLKNATNDTTATDDVANRKTSSTTTTKEISIEEIDDFAEKLASKIERSGSEEAAATLALHEEIENINSLARTPIALITASENLVSAMSENQPSTIHGSDPEDRYRKISPAIMEFITEDNESDNVDPVNRGFQDERNLVAPPQFGKIDLNEDLLKESQLNDFSKETEAKKSNPADVLKSLEVEPSEVYNNSQLESDKLDDDNLSDDLSESPPQFIPDPPPKEVEEESGTLNLIDLSIQGQQQSDRSPPQEQEKSRQFSIQKTQKIPSNSLLQNERNSRSSEDIIKAVNNESRTTAARNRPGASTLPLNTRPPVDGRGSFRPLRNMLNRFRKNKHKQSNMSLSDEMGLTLPSNNLGSRPQQLNEEDEATVGGNETHAKSKRRNSSASGSKKSNIFARLFSRKNK